MGETAGIGGKSRFDAAPSRLILCRPVAIWVAIGRLNGPRPDPRTAHYEMITVPGTSAGAVNSCLANAPNLAGNFNPPFMPPVVSSDLSMVVEESDVCTKGWKQARTSARVLAGFAQQFPA
jgi:hypothetical protein